ncbi:MAG: hypothetical protein GTN99_05105 [Candidatus Dadabacteria bacterium]|nr:hypothetical protein [Candidatus Dadabacteria bacterium]
MAKEFKNEFSWSFSRDSMFNECKRKYYYNYYGSWEGWKKDSADEVTRTLYVLKNLVNMKIWKGDAVHKEISRVLKSFETTDVIGSFESSVKRATKIMRDEFRFSKAKEYWNTDKSLRKVNALFEHEYDVDISDDEWIDNYNDVIRCLKNFHNSEIVDELKSVGCGGIITVDSITPTSFDYNGEIIYVNLDLAYKVDDEVKIIDWKTGAGESNPLQFVVYVFHTNEILKTPLDRLSVIEYNLQENKQYVHRYNEREISEAKEYIDKSMSEMKGCLYDPAENLADINDFPRTEDEWKCANCNFKKICFELP